MFTFDVSGLYKPALKCMQEYISKVFVNNIVAVYLDGSRKVGTS